VVIFPTTNPPRVKSLGKGGKKKRLLSVELLTFVSEGRKRERVGGATSAADKRKEEGKIAAPDPSASSGGVRVRNPYSSKKRGSKASVKGKEKEEKKLPDHP